MAAAEATICSVPVSAGEWVLQYVESIPSCVSQVLIQCLCTERKEPDLHPPARLALKVTYKGKEDKRVPFVSILNLHQAWNPSVQPESKPAGNGSWDSKCLKRQYIKILSNPLFCYNCVINRAQKKAGDKRHRLNEETSLSRSNK